ncbi:MAG: c-type cytochrome [Woeseiaceae bacterium]|nr:c-type cytochrome [Woeseiaceae bacterium]
MAVVNRSGSFRAQRGKLLLLVLAAAFANAEPANIQVCAACHGEDGAGVGHDYVPIIAGTPAAHLEEALYAYKDGARKCIGVPVMCDAIAPLSDDDIVEMADYYAAMPRLSTDEEFDRQLAAVGKIIHDDLCAQCHVLPTDENVEDALGIPLNGQKGAYLRLALGAYLTGDRETLVPIMSDKLRLLDQDKIEALVHYYASWDPES